MERFIGSLATGLYIQICLLIGIFVVTVGIGAFAITALHGQEIYAWVMQQPALAPLTGGAVLLSGLKIDPTGASSEALFINNGILGMLVLSSAAVSIRLPSSRKGWPSEKWSTSCTRNSPRIEIQTAR